MEHSQSNKRLVSWALMYIHVNINRTQTSKENYLLLSSLLVSLLWGPCRVRYSGWALLFAPRTLETHLRICRGAQERFLFSQKRGISRYARGTPGFRRNPPSPSLLQPIIFLERSRNIFFRIHCTEEFHPWKKKNERRRIQQLKNFQLVSHSLRCLQNGRWWFRHRRAFLFEIVAPMRILKTRFESIIFHATSPQRISDTCTWLNRIFLHCWQLHSVLRNFDS